MIVPHPEILTAWLGRPGSTGPANAKNTMADTNLRQQQPWPPTSMNLHQIKIDFLPEHDRLLLAISTAPSANDAGQEMLLWLTRRGVKLLWPALMQLASATPAIAVQNHPEA